MSDIKVSQRACEAAADRFETAFGPTDLSRKMRQGLHDCGPMVQALARFEQAARADEREKAAKVAECLECPADMLIATRMDWSRHIAAAIRAQGDEA